MAARAGSKSKLSKEVHMKPAFAACAVVFAFMGVSQAQLPAESTVPVTADNFTRAESDAYFAKIVKQAGGLGKFFHRRELEPVESQIVIRANRDTLYSAAVFDLNAGPVTVKLPKAGKRFMSMIVIDEDQYVPAVYYGGNHTFTKSQIGTRYLMLALRTLVDPSDAEDTRAAHALQNAVMVIQRSPGNFEIPAWDAASHKKVKDALLILASTLPDSDRGFGKKGEVDPVRRLILSASAWGGNPDKEAKYLNVFPTKNDGETIYTLNVRNVPVEGFWSISLYNAAGNFQKNPYDAYSLNNITAKKSEDGSVAVQFGGCDGKIPNCLPTMPGWNYMVRLYRPRTEILNGTWKFPEAQPAD
jgi:hypothetical protein